MEYEEETELPSRKRRKKILYVSLAAIIVALFATLTVWYVFATDDFHRVFRLPHSENLRAEADNPAAAKEAATIGLSAPADSIADTTATGQNEEVPTAPSDPVVYDTISTTRYLTTMAKSHYGNYNLWPYIYEENKAFLGHPDRIRPGTPVVIPKLTKYGVDPTNKDDIEKAKQLGVDIYARYGKKI